IAIGVADVNRARAFKRAVPAWQGNLPRGILGERPLTPENSFRKTVLPSGLTLVTETMPDRQSVSVGVWLRNGARDEPSELLGVSHFIEHMMFKGTSRRDARAIAKSLESLGGHLDALTAREPV